MSTIYLPKLAGGWPTDAACDFRLPRSKSESNRLLVLKAVAEPGMVQIAPLSEARDTHLLARALAVTEGLVNVEDAGTAMRFATAFHALKGHSVELRGTPRMHERPIGPLVGALRQLGASIEYLGQDGYPPLKITGYQDSGIGEVLLDARQSSQFATALLLCAPLLPGGLRLRLVGEVASMSYLNYTLQVLRRVGLKVEVSEGSVVVEPGLPAGGVYETEADWSSAGYAFSLAGMMRRPLFLKGLKLDSHQADRAIVPLFARLGVQARVMPDGIQVQRDGEIEPELEVDFSPIPDQAQTFAAYAAAQGIRLTMTGLATLRIKETDRIAALQEELGKFGVGLVELGGDRFQVQGKALAPMSAIRAHGDHRMAMSLGVLSARYRFEVEGAETVAKSFPQFWAEMMKLR